MRWHYKVKRGALEEVSFTTFIHIHADWNGMVAATQRHTSHLFLGISACIEILNPKDPE